MAQSCEERLHKMHKVYEEAYQFQERRIQQLEEALKAVSRCAPRFVGVHDYFYLPGPVVMSVRAALSPSKEDAGE